MDLAIMRRQIIENALTAPKDHIKRALTAGIRDMMPNAYVVQSPDIYGSMCRFAAKGHAQLELRKDVSQDFMLYASDGETHLSPAIVWIDVVHKGNRFEFLQIPISQGYHSEEFSVLIAENREMLDQFLIDLDEFEQKIEGAVLVFQEGCWRFDEELYKEIQGSTFDNLILPTGEVERICNDIQGWLDAREIYESHRIPWKRGMILVGPPGNGKTHMIKALINHFKLNTLYVRGFTSEYGTDSANISKVFSRARDCAPCMIVLEDLDTLVTPEIRSHFLNEMDGFALNSGLLVIASANDPAKLDPALVNRPSRFDRRYPFSLPGTEERANFLGFLSASLDSRLQLAPDETKSLAAATDGFSYAYLKELVLSSMMAWISGGSEKPFAEVVAENVGPLLDQMHFKTDDLDESVESDEDGEMEKAMQSARKMMERVRRMNPYSR